MRRITCGTGKRMFSVDEFLTAQQIMSYFSRIAADKRDKAATSLASANDEDVIAAECEEHFDAVQQEASKCILTHPVIAEGHNLCEMLAQKKINKLKKEELQNICMFLDITKEKSKAKCIDNIMAILKTCQCAQM